MPAIVTPYEFRAPLLAEPDPRVFVSTTALPISPRLAALLRAAPSCSWQLFRVAAPDPREVTVETLVIGDLAWQARGDQLQDGRWDKETQRIFLASGETLTLRGTSQGELRRAQPPADPVADQRRDPRVRGAMTVRISGPVPETAVTHDVSRSGAFIRTGTPRPVGTKLALRLVSRHLPAPLLFAAEVVRTQNGRNPGMGVRFVFAGSLQRTAVELLVDRLAIAG